MMRTLGQAFAIVAALLILIGEMQRLDDMQTDAAIQQQAVRQ